MAVIFINRFFYPDVSATSQILSDLAFDLASRSRTVLVITSRLTYEGTRPALAAHEVVDDVTIHRVWTSGFGRARLIGRAVDYLTFYLSAFWRLLRLARAGDLVVAKTDPPLISVAVMPACLLRRAHLVNWLQDLFPEVAQAAGIGRGGALAYAAVRWVRTCSLRVAAANVAIGHTMAARLTALGVRDDKIAVIPNWADGAAIRPLAHADNPFRQAAGVGDAFVVGYSGNLGRVHDIATVVEAMTILAEQDETRDHQHIRWLFIGGGALTSELQAEIRTRGLANVGFMPYQPRSVLAQSLSAADAHLASLRCEFESLVVPSKVFGGMAAGRPILFVGDPAGEVGQLIARKACGYAIRPGDGASLAEAIRVLAGDSALRCAMGRRAREAFEAEFDRATAMASWAALIENLTARVPGT